MRLQLLIAALATCAAGVLAVTDGLRNEAASAVAAADGLRDAGSGADANYTEMVRFQGQASCADLAREKNGSWHAVSQCVRPLRNTWEAAKTDTARAKVAGEVRAAILATMRRNSTGYRSSQGMLRGQAGLDRLSRDLAAGRGGELRIVELNDVGQAYNAMGQTGLAYFVLQFAKYAQDSRYEGHQADARIYRALAEGMVRTVLTPAGEGGLAGGQACRGNSAQQCVLYHSVTRRDRASNAGATLNQHLHAVRDLGLIEDVYQRYGWTAPFDLRRAIADGLNQLFLQAPRSRAGQYPSFEDYLTGPRGNSDARWLHYGFDPGKSAGAGGYFLPARGQNCHYQIHSLSLIWQALEEAQIDRAWPVDRALSCEGPLAQSYRATKAALAGGGAARSSAGGEFDTYCAPEDAKTFAMIDDRFYAKAFRRCSTAR